MRTVAKLKGRDDDHRLLLAVENAFDSLAPFLEPDYQLLDAVAEAVSKRQNHVVRQISDLANTIWRFRSAQAYGFPNELPLDFVAEGIRHLGSNLVGRLPESVEEVRRLVAEGIGLDIPSDITAERYIEVVSQNGETMCREVDSLIKRSVRESGNVNMTLLLNEIVALNEELRRVTSSDRNKILRATVGFAGANKALVGALLVGGTLGLSGSAVGCGSAIAAGAVTWILDKTGKISLPKASSGAARVVHRKLEPVVQRVLSFYLGTDLSTIQLMRVKEKLRGERD